MKFKVIKKEAEQLTKNEELIKKVANFIFSGGAINNIDDIVNNLKRIHKLFLLFDMGEIGEEKLIGVSAIKNPNRNYAARLFKKFNLEYNNEKEVGYVCIDKKYRSNGLGKLMLSIALMNVIEENLSVFLTCDSKNEPIIKINNLYKLPLIGQYNANNNKVINFYLIT